MTSNGNTAHKLLIKNFIKETNEATRANRKGWQPCGTKPHQQNII